MRDALAEFVEPIHVFHGPEMIGILLANQNANLALRFGALQIRCAIHSQEIVAARRDQSVPTADVAQRTGMHIAVCEAHRRMEDRDSRILQPFEIGRQEAARLGLPGCQLVVVQGHQPQHVDNGAAVDQVDGEGGVTCFVLGVERETAAIDHRRGDSKRRASQKRST